MRARGIVFHMKSLIPYWKVKSFAKSNDLLFFIVWAFSHEEGTTKTLFILNLPFFPELLFVVAMPPCWSLIIFHFDRQESGTKGLD